jgi:hypothetical protein
MKLVSLFRGNLQGDGFVGALTKLHDGKGAQVIQNINELNIPAAGVTACISCSPGSYFGSTGVFWLQSSVLNISCE